MALYEIEVIYTCKYKRRVRATDEQEAQDKAAAMWIDRDLKHMVDEYADYIIYPVAYEPAPKFDNAASTERDE